MHGSQAHRGIDGDLAKALVDRAEHGVEDDQAGDEHGNGKGAESLDGAQPHRAQVEDGRPVAVRLAQAGVETGAHARQVLLDER